MREGEHPTFPFGKFSKFGDVRAKRVRLLPPSARFLSG